MEQNLHRSEFAGFFLTYNDCTCMAVVFTLVMRCKKKNPNKCVQTQLHLAQLSVFIIRSKSIGRGFYCDSETVQSETIFIIFLLLLTTVIDLT